jgi:hypothetical protein
VGTSGVRQSVLSGLFWLTHLAATWDRRFRLTLGDRRLPSRVSVCRAPHAVGSLPGPEIYLAVVDCLGQVSFSKVGFNEMPKSSAATQSDPSCQPIMIEREPVARSIRKRPMIALRQQADHFGPTSCLAPSRFGNQRYVDHARPSACAGLHSPLAKCRTLHITLGMIAVECGRIFCGISMALAEADFGK